MNEEKQTMLGGIAYPATINSVLSHPSIGSAGFISEWGVWSFIAVMVCLGALPTASPIA